MLSYDKLHENQRNLFDTVVKGMKLEFRKSLYEIFTSPDCSEDLNAVLSAKRDENGNVFSILTYCFYEENIIFNNFYELIGLADKYQDAFRKLFEEESTIDGKSYTALSYAREHSSRLGTALEKVIEEKMKKLGLKVPAQPSQPVDQSNVPFVGEGLNLGALPLPTQEQLNGTVGSYSRGTSISSDSSGDEGQSPAGPSDPDYATHLRGTSVLSDNDNTSEKSPTFWDKNKGKIAAVSCIAGMLCVAGALFAGLPFGIACAAGVIGGLAILAAIGIAGEMVDDKVSNMATEYGISKSEAAGTMLKDLFSKKPDHLRYSNV